MRNSFAPANSAMRSSPRSERSIGLRRDETVKRNDDRYDVAVVGATGAVGEAMISILQQREFPVANLYPLASQRSAGTRIEFQGKHRTVGDLEDFDFSKVQ